MIGQEEISAQRMMAVGRPLSYNRNSEYCGTHNLQKILRVGFLKFREDGVEIELNSLSMNKVLYLW